VDGTEDYASGRRTSQVKRLVNDANLRCESKCTDLDDMRYPLAFTVFENRNGPVSKHYALGASGKIESSKARAVLYDARGYRAECRDLEGLAESLDKLPASAAIANGLFDEPEVRITTLAQAKGTKVSRSREHMRWRDGPGIVAFDVDIQAGHEEVGGLPITPRTMDALLRAIVPWWGGIDRLYRYSPSSGIADLKGALLKPLKNFRIFIAIDDMTQTESIGAEVHTALHDAGHGWIELAANGNMLDRTLIDPCMYRPEHLIYVNPSLGAGLKRIEMKSLLVRGASDRLEVACRGFAGKIADWRRSSPAYKALVEAKLPEQRAFVKQLKEQAREAARAKGEPEELVAAQVEQIAGHWLPPEFEICLESGRAVTCRELLENPDKYDGKRCCEPTDWSYRDEDPRIGLIYLKDGLAQIYSHAHGGTRYYLQALPVPAEAFDEFPPLTDDEKAEAVAIASRKAGASGGNRRKAVAAEDAVLAELNERHAFVMIEGQAMVINDHGKGKFTYSREKDFVAKYANRFLPPLSEDDEPFPIAKYWWKHAERRQYSGIEFNLGEPTPGRFNLWKGFAVEPAETGRCNLFMDYIRDVVCGGDVGLCEWVLSWVAHIVQHPEQKPGTALVLRGLKGSGKTFLGDVIRALLPNNSAILSKPDDLLGNFNSHLQTALFVQVEEAFWAGSKAAEGHLKTLITSPTIGITPKFVNRYEVASYSRFLITSNEAWVVPASLDERRFVVVDVSNTHRRDREYFGAVWDQLKNGGFGRLMFELSNYSLTADPMTSRATAGLFDQVVESFHPAERFVWEMLKSGVISGQESGFETAQAWPEDGESAPVLCSDLYDSFRRFEKDRAKHATSEDAFGRKLKQLIPGIRKYKGSHEGRRPYFYYLPGLLRARADFSALQESVIEWESADENDEF
jgi:hypothetical protein